MVGPYLDFFPCFYAGDENLREFLKMLHMATKIENERLQLL